MGKVVIGRAFRRFVKPGEILWAHKGVEPHPPLPPVVPLSPADAPPPSAVSAGVSNGGGASDAGEVLP